MTTPNYRGAGVEVTARGYTVAPVRPPGAARGGRGQQLPTGPITLQTAGNQVDPVVAALADQGFDLHDVPLTIAPEPGRRRGAQPAQLRADVGADEDAVVLVEQDGYYQWFAPVDRSEASVAFDATRSPLDPPVATRTITFAIPLNGSSPAETRGLKKLVLGPIRTFVLKFVARKVTGKIIDHLESHITPRLLQLANDPAARERPDTAWQPVSALPELPQGRAPRVLLFVHGTFSSTVGGFGALSSLPAGVDLLARADSSYDIVLGFDHKTLGVDPGANAAELLGFLRGLPWPEPPVVDIVCHSRGALVVRCLVEEALPQSGWAARSDRIVFVGGTNGGTQLASPENWKTFIDISTNLAAAAARLIPEQFAATVLAEAIKTIGAFVKAVLSYSLDDNGVPGIAAMQPGKAFVTDINKTQPGQPAPGTTQWFVVAGNFDPQLLGDGAPPLPKRLLLALADAGVDALMHGRANDLVVDTASMSAIDTPVGTPSGFVREILTFEPKQHVFHTVYFAQSATAEKLVAWFQLPPVVRPTRSPRPRRTRRAATAPTVNLPPAIGTVWHKEFGAVLGSRGVGGMFPTSGVLMPELPGRLIRGGAAPSISAPIPSLAGPGRSVDRQPGRSVARKTAKKTGAKATKKTPASGPITAFFRASMASEARLEEITTLTVTVGREQLAAVAGISDSGAAAVVGEQKITIQVVIKAQAEVAGVDRVDIDVPPADEPTDLYFDIRPLASGIGEIHVVARQGPIPLVTMILKPKFMKRPHKKVEALPVAVDNVVTSARQTCVKQWLRITQREIGAATIYDFELEASDLRILEKASSAPITGDRAAYVASIYQRIEDRFVGNLDDSTDFAAELRALGGDLFDELIPLGFAEMLWQNRNKLRNILVLSDEPFIPWELVHLKAKVGAKLPSETVFLGQLGAMRWLQGTYPPATLEHHNVRSLVPAYPDGSGLELPATVQEGQFLTDTLQATPLPAKSSAVLAALRDSHGFDILHFAGHGEADGSTARILLDGRVDGTTYVPESFYDTTVRQNADLHRGDASGAMVVLNACQAGRVKPELTHPGGFANACVNSGAAAFISTLWSVGDAAALAFTKALYQKLLSGATLAQASVAARQAARKAGGEATWLAYVVYGDPCATFVP